MPGKQENEQHIESPPASVPNPDFLKLYAGISPDLPVLVMREWMARNRRPFIYAMASLIGGIVLALALVAGFVYLAMNDHGGYAVTLLGAGAISMVAGFRAARL